MGHFDNAIERGQTDWKNVLGQEEGGDRERSSFTGGRKTENADTDVSTGPRCGGGSLQSCSFGSFTLLSAIGSKVIS